jgi:hypothetical protein
MYPPFLPLEKKGLQSTRVAHHLNLAELGHKLIQGAHTQSTVDLAVIIFLQPLPERAVQVIQRFKVLIFNQGQETLPDGQEEALMPNLA